MVEKMINNFMSIVEEVSPRDVKTVHSEEKESQNFQQIQDIYKIQDDSIRMNNTETILDKSITDLKKHKQKISILDLYESLRIRQTWNKGFRYKIQPVYPENMQLCKQDNEIIEEAYQQQSSLNDNNNNDKRNERGSTPRAKIKKRPNTAPPSIFLNSSPSIEKPSIPCRPSTAASSSISLSVDLDDDNSTEIIDFAEILRKSFCTKNQFRKSFDQHSSIPPKDASIVYEDISSGYFGSMKHTLPLAKSNEKSSFSIPKKIINANKKDSTVLPFTGLLLILDPRTNTDSRLVNIQVKVDSIDKHDTQSQSIEPPSFQVLGNGSPFHLVLNSDITSSITHANNNNSSTNSPSKVSNRKLPGWQEFSPIWIPNLNCTFNWSYSTITTTSTSILTSEAEEVTIEKGVAAQQSSHVILNDSPYIAQESSIQQFQSVFEEYLPKSSQPLVPLFLSFLLIPCASISDGYRTIDKVLFETQRKRTANMRIPGGQLPALHVAALNGNSEAVKQLLLYGGNPNLRSPLTRSTALHEAVLAGHSHIAIYLIENGINICYRDNTGSTALHISCRQQNIVMTRILLRLITIPKVFTIKDGKDRKPVDVCESSYLKKLVKDAMVRHGISVRPPRVPVFPQNNTSKKQTKKESSPTLSSSHL